MQLQLSSCNYSTKSENVRTKFETKLIMYRHYVSTLLNRYFKLCLHYTHAQLRRDKHVDDRSL